MFTIPTYNSLTVKALPLALERPWKRRQGIPGRKNGPEQQQGGSKGPNQPVSQRGGDSLCVPCRLSLCFCGCLTPRRQRWPQPWALFSTPLIWSLRKERLAEERSPHRRTVLRNRGADAERSLFPGWNAAHQEKTWIFITLGKLLSICRHSATWTPLGRIHPTPRREVVGVGWGCWIQAEMWIPTTHSECLSGLQLFSELRAKGIPQRLSQRWSVEGDGWGEGEGQGV